MDKIVYGVSLGAGFETMTLQAAKILKNSDVILLSSSTKYNNPDEVEEILKTIDCEHKLISVDMPASSDKSAHKEHTKKFAEKCMEFINKGKQTAYVSMGDISVYSSYPDLYKIFQTNGVKLVGISGISAFMAPAITVGTGLAQWDGNFCVIPSPKNEQTIAKYVADFDTVIIMKIYDNGEIIKKFLKTNNVSMAVMVINAYKPNEKVLYLTKEFPKNEDFHMSVVLIRK